MDTHVQVRYNNGMLAQSYSLIDALKFNDGDWDKISFSVSDSERFIIYRDGTWEHRTPESLKKQALASYDLGWDVY